MMVHRGQMLQLVSSHDGWCDSDKCSSALCATVSPSLHPRSHYGSLWHACEMFGSPGLVSSPSHWSQSDLMAPALKSPAHYFQSHYDRMKNFFFVTEWTLRWDVHRHFTASSLWKPCPAAIHQTWPHIQACLHARTTHTHAKSSDTDWLTNLLIEVELS